MNIYSRFQSALRLFDGLFVKNKTIYLNFFDRLFPFFIKEGVREGDILMNFSYRLTRLYVRDIKLNTTVYI